MTHGPEYRVRDGKRPAWLDDDDVVAICESGEWLGLAHDWRTGWWGWGSSVSALRLKDPNHWANAPIAAGLEPWAGGDAPPADFKPGGRVMFRDGGVLTPRQPKTMRWRHDGLGGDIIGYERTEEPPLAELQRLGQEAEAVLAEPTKSFQAMTEALVIGATSEAIAAAAMLRRAGIVTETKWGGKVKKHLASTKAEVVVIADGERFIVRDMILREQRDTTMETLQADLCDAFDGYLVDPRPLGSPA